MNTFALTRARWDVRWVVDRRIVVVDCADDFAEATRIYTLAVAGGRRDVTLRCKNVAIPPPARLRVVHERKTPDGIERVPHLHSYNLRGWWWCPYCAQLRKFKVQRGFSSDGQWVPEPGYHCPMCSISHRDSSVRRWNPLADRLYVEGVRMPRR